MTGWQQLLYIAALTLAWNVGRDLLRAWRRSRQARTPLPELFAVGNSLGDPDTGERWLITNVRLDAVSGDDPRLTVDLIRRSPRTIDPEGA